MQQFYTDTDKDRVLNSDATTLQTHRTPFSRDLSRLIHSPSFRRLEGKTQLYPGIESDFFRNRLTHSMEVAEIAKSITEKINQELYLDKKNPENKIDSDVVITAALAHDLGHAPFGHIGEKALDYQMREFGRFEGNAQTLRIIAKLEKKEVMPGGSIFYHGFDVKGRDYRIGLNLTYRALASVIKYDNCIDSVSPGDYEKVDKGYYKSEEKLVSIIKKKVLNGYKLEDGEKFKTVECSIMDLADDIAYTTYDLEDALKGNFISILDLLDTKKIYWKDTIEDINNAVRKNSKIYSDIPIFVYPTDIPLLVSYIAKLLAPFMGQLDNARVEKFIKNPEKFAFDFQAYIGSKMHLMSKLLSDNAYARNQFTTSLVDHFIKNIRFEPKKKCLPLSKVYLDKDAFLSMEVLKQFIYHSQIKSPRLQIADYRGEEIIDKIFETLFLKEKFNLLPPDYQTVFYNCFDGKKNKEKARLVCDYIAGMTNKYAIEFYGRLTSENAETIFKPF